MVEVGDSILISTCILSFTLLTISFLQIYATHKSSLPGMLLTLKGKVT